MRGRSSWMVQGVAAGVRQAGLGTIAVVVADLGEVMRAIFLAAASSLPQRVRGPNHGGTGDIRCLVATVSFMISTKDPHSNPRCFAPVSRPGLRFL